MQYFSAFTFFLSFFFFLFLSYCVWGLLSQASRKVEFFLWRRLNNFFLLVSALLRLVQWFVWALSRVRFLLSVCLFSSDGQGWVRRSCLLMIWFVFLFCLLFRASCTGCYWSLGDAASCIQVVSSVWVLTTWHSLGLGLWSSRVLESVLPLQTLRSWSLVRNKDSTRGCYGIKWN